MANKKKNTRKSQGNRKQVMHANPTVAAPSAPIEQVAPVKRAAAAPSRPVSAARRPGAPLVTVSRETIAQAQANFAEEYHYVITDLKRIGLLAAVMFILLVALALVLR